MLRSSAAKIHLRRLYWWGYAKPYAYGTNRDENNEPSICAICVLFSHQKAGWQLADFSAIVLAVGAQHFSEPKVAMMKQWETLDAVERAPDKVSGVWVFRGTRVPVSALFENLRDGATITEFLEWFPGVERAQVEAVLDYELKTLAVAA